MFAELPDRRTFLALLAKAAAGLFGSADHPGGSHAPNWGLGHLVGTRFSKFDEKDSAEIVIVGGGMGGLCAGWHLLKSGFTNFKILELEEEVGGNSRGFLHTPKKGDKSLRAPWGAHYVTFANSESKDLRSLYKDLGVILSGEDSEAPKYNPDFCCYDLNSRILVKDTWEQGITPTSAFSSSDEVLWKRFEAWVHSYKEKRDADGKPWFAIPSRLSSPDSLFLDSFSFTELLNKEGFQSETLHWYVRYCMRDDFGTEPEQISAWVGLSYFASRRGRASNIDNTNVITWPEGNAWIVNQLRTRLQKHIFTNQAVLKVETNEQGVVCHTFEGTRGKSRAWHSKAAILAVPGRVYQKLVPNSEVLSFFFSNQQSTPWMIANLEVDQKALEQDCPFGLAWDSVHYQATSLGYVVESHQRQSARSALTLATLYFPFSAENPSETRQWWNNLDRAQQTDFVVAEMERFHPGISDHIKSIDTWFWPHAMPRPAPGNVKALWAEQKKRVKETERRVFHAHSEVSGMSLFEEALDAGVQAAKGALERLQS